MMKPGIGSYDKFKQLFEKFSAEAGKKQYLIPYFIAAHPGTSDEDMMNLAIWLKKNGFRADQVQTFYPSPMATATAMYHTNRNPLRKITRDSEDGGHRARRKAPPPAQGLPALPRREQLAAAARGAQGHGPRRPDRQRQAPPDPDLAAADRRQLPERAPQELDRSARPSRPPSRKRAACSRSTPACRRATPAAPSPRRAGPGNSSRWKYSCHTPAGQRCQERPEGRGGGPASGCWPAAWVPDTTVWSSMSLGCSTSSSMMKVR